MSLTRVIAEQQARIDRLEESLKISHEYARINHERQEKLMELLWGMITYSIHQDERDRNSLKQYMDEARSYLVSIDFCIMCASRPCECDRYS